MKYAGCNGTITVEGDVLILTREGMIARAQGLAGPPRRIPLHAISGVFLKDSTRLLDGHLTLGLGGASAAEHAASGAADDPDTVVFRRKDQDAFRALHDWLVTVVKENSEQGIDPSTVIYDVGRSSVEAALQVNGFGNQDNNAGDAATNRFLTDRSKLHSELNQELDVNLSPGETVEVIIAGPSNQTVIGTDRRVFIYKKGFMAGAAFGFEMTSWDYRNLNGVQLHTGMMSGAVVIQAPGQSGTKTSYWGSGDDDPYKAPNAIPVLRPFDQAQAGVAKLRQMIEAAHRPVDTGSGKVGIAGASVADELKKLVELRDVGALSDEEFAALKARLLSI